MDAIEEVLASPPCRNNNDPSPPIAAIIKGKRTKRYKLHSPNPFTISPPTIAGNYEITSSEESTTTEEEDTARCLILLARGDHDHSQHDRQYSRQNINHSSRKRHVETTCVYACKTCGRVFASFQALGGHRASHKKPKNEKRSSIVLSNEEDFPSLKRTNPPNYSVSLQFSKSDHNIVSPKVHVCSYCGAEFASGQALGGHMRRHRGGPISPSSNNAAVEEPEPEMRPGHGFEGMKKAGNGLCLDLNLPAAAADDENRRFGVIDYLHHSNG